MDSGIAMGKPSDLIELALFGRAEKETKLCVDAPAMREDLRVQQKHSNFNSQRGKSMPE